MTAINHAVTGAVIGLIVGQPLVAIPVAFASHFVCDALPHFGLVNQEPTQIFKTHGFRDYLIIEAGLCFTLVVMLAIFRPAHWFLAALCAFLATSPDLFWINRYRLARHGKAWKPNLFSRFADRIQWFQRPLGGIVEVVWLGSAIVLILPFFR